MIPTPLWGINLRKILTEWQWRKLRQQIISSFGLTCQLCEKQEIISKDICAHEEWEYEIQCSPAMAHLKGIGLCCRYCHAIEHFGRTRMMVLSGRIPVEIFEATVDHFCRVNGVTRDVFWAHVGEVNATWEELNKLNWVVDWGPFEQMVSALPRQPFAIEVRGVAP
jgi:hypothetical protein